MGEEVKLQSVSLDDEEDAASAMENGNGLADAKVVVDVEGEGTGLLTGGAKKSATLDSDSEDEDDGVNKNNMNILIISSVMGNILEWYDFGVFASFSSELSHAFFTGGRLEEMLKVYGVFAAAFFARPLGGFLLGLIGDKYARTLSLQISVVAMGASALFISVLPTNTVGSYKIGPAATFMLVGARIIQGLSTGGEMVGSMLYMVENVPDSAKCFVSAIPMSSAIAGTGMGYLVSAIITALVSEEQRILWGWRLAFFIGVPAGAVGFMFRSCLSESHSFAKASKDFSKRHGNQHPFFYAVRHCLPALLTICFLAMLVTGYYSGTTWYNQAWLEEFYTELVGEERALDKLHGRTINTLLLLGGLSMGTLVAAYVVDRNPQIPLHKYMIVSATSLVFFSPVALYLMSYGNECIACVVVGQSLSIALFVFTVAPISYWLCNLFPPTLQYTTIALSYNFGQCIFGGTVPFISTQISSNSSNVIAPAYYLSALALLGASALLMFRLEFVKEMKQKLEIIMSS